MALTIRTLRPSARTVLACSALTAMITALPADAHSPVVTGTIKHGGTAFGSTLGQRLTIKALQDSGCTAPTLGGQDVNNFDAAVVKMAGLALHKVTATYTTTIEGTSVVTPAGAPATGIFLQFLDKSCAVLPYVGKEKINSYKVPTAPLTVPTKAKWLVVAIDSEARSANYKLTFKHPPPPKKK